ncbi:MAG: hypothetical protein ACLRSW_06870 [Christensenellaceae bacterium]
MIALLKRYEECAIKGYDEEKEREARHIKCEIGEGWRHVGFGRESLPNLTYFIELLSPCWVRYPLGTSTTRIPTSCRRKVRADFRPGILRRGAGNLLRSGARDVYAGNADVRRAL